MLFKSALKMGKNFLYKDIAIANLYAGLLNKLFNMYPKIEYADRIRVYYNEKQLPIVRNRFDTLINSNQTGNVYIDFLPIVQNQLITKGLLAAGALFFLGFIIRGGFKAKGGLLR